MKTPVQSQGQHHITLSAPPSRRDFLKISAALAASMPLARFAFAENATRATDENILRATSLLFDKSDLPRMRETLKHPRLAEIRATLFDVDFAGETAFLKNLRLNNHVADFMRAWQILQNAAFAFAVAGDERQLALARLALRRLLDYKRWDYFLDGGVDTIGLQRAPEACIATCYALDWLGDSLTSAEREETLNKIASEGAPACYRTLYGLKYPDRVRGWGFDSEDDYKFRFDLSRWPLILNATNLKVIPICGLGLAAITLQGRHPEANKWLNMARQSAQAFSTMYNPDGSYDEGAGYWGYTTMHLAIFAEALHRRTGLDDRKLINYSGTVRYAQAMSMPCGGDITKDPKLAAEYNATPRGNYDPRLDIVNFSDAFVGADTTIATWVGAITRDPFCQHVASHTGALKMLQAAVWYRPDAPEAPPPAAMLDTRLDNDWLISRTGWTADDTVVAFRSGGPANHEHADRNNVILKAHGERLFHDPFKAGYSHTVPRWLLRQTEAHTAVLIDGHGHQYHDGSEGTNASKAVATITDYRTGSSGAGDWMLATSDATDAYKLVLPAVTRVTRTLLFLKPGALIILDNVHLTAAAPVQLRFQVFNDDKKGSAAIASDRSARFTITRPLATLQATYAAQGSVTARVAQLALPPEEGVFPYAEIVSASATSHTIVTACTVAPAQTGHGALTITREGATGWRIKGAHSGQNINALLTLASDGTVTATV